MYIRAESQGSEQLACSFFFSFKLGGLYELSMDVKFIFRCYIKISVFDFTEICVFKTGISYYKPVLHLTFCAVGRFHDHPAKLILFVHR